MDGGVIFYQDLSSAISPLCIGSGSSILFRSSQIPGPFLLSTPTQTRRTARSFTGDSQKRRLTARKKYALGSRLRSSLRRVNPARVLFRTKLARRPEFNCYSLQNYSSSRVCFSYLTFTSFNYYFFEYLTMASLPHHSKEYLWS